MRKLISMGALALSLAGCATTGGAPATDVSSFIAQVQATTAAVCAFEPTAATVADIIGTISGPAGAGIAATASGIAAAICNAVAPPPASGRLRAAGPPTVAGVVIHGKFLR